MVFHYVCACVYLTPNLISLSRQTLARSFAHFSIPTKMPGMGETKDEKERKRKNEKNNSSGKLTSRRSSIIVPNTKRFQLLLAFSITPPCFRCDYVRCDSPPFVVVVVLSFVLSLSLSLLIFESFPNGR